MFYAVSGPSTNVLPEAAVSYFQVAASRVQEKALLFLGSILPYEPRYPSLYTVAMQVGHSLMLFFWHLNSLSLSRSVKSSLLDVSDFVTSGISVY